MTSLLESAPEHAPERARRVRLGAWVGVAAYTQADDEYRATQSGVGLADRSYRGLLEVTGAERAAWLHNLTTNQIKDLQPGDGNYGFAVNAKGRILFDLNALILPDAIWLDIDARWIADAVRHFEKFTVIEDVALRDRSAEYLRFTLIGAAAGRCVAALGASNAVAAPFLHVGHVDLGDARVAFFRHDLCGADAFDLLAPAAAVRPVLAALRSCQDVTLIGYDAVDTLRIEGGVPWPISEINDTVLPAETAQLERAVSFSKGCYLGQEIVARMMSRKSLARVLVLVRFDGADVPAVGASLRSGDQEIGHVTSACSSPRYGGPVALGYVRAAHAAEGSAVRAAWDAGAAGGRVVAAPGGA